MANAVARAQLKNQQNQPLQIPAANPTLDPESKEAVQWQIRQMHLTSLEDFRRKIELYKQNSKGLRGFGGETGSVIHCVFVYPARELLGENKKLIDRIEYLMEIFAALNRRYNTTTQTAGKGGNKSVTVTYHFVKIFVAAPDQEEENQPKPLISLDRLDLIEQAIGNQRLDQIDSVRYIWEGRPVRRATEEKRSSTGASGSSSNTSGTSPSVQLHELKEYVKNKYKIETMPTTIWLQAKDVGDDGGRGNQLVELDRLEEPNIHKIINKNKKYVQDKLRARVKEMSREEIGRELQSIIYPVGGEEVRNL